MGREAPIRAGFSRQRSGAITSRFHRNGPDSLGESGFWRLTERPLIRPWSRRRARGRAADEGAKPAQRRARGPWPRPRRAVAGVGGRRGRAQGLGVGARGIAAPAPRGRAVQGRAVASMARSRHLVAWPQRPRAQGYRNRRGGALAPAPSRGSLRPCPTRTPDGYSGRWPSWPGSSCSRAPSSGLVGPAAAGARLCGPDERQDGMDQGALAQPPVARGRFTFRRRVRVWLPRAAGHRRLALERVPRSPLLMLVYPVPARRRPQAPAVSR